MKKQKILIFLGMSLGVSLIISNAVLASPPNPPPSPNATNAVFNSITTDAGSDAGLYSQSDWVSVYAYNSGSGYGVFGYSPTGTGLYGYSGGNAGFFYNPTTANSVTLGSSSNGALNVNDGASGKGITMNASNRPLITRAWDAFTSGTYNGVGRWGLFMQPNYITLGYPNITGKGVKITSFNSDSTIGKDSVKLDDTGITLNSTLIANGSAPTNLDSLITFCNLLNTYAGSDYSMVSNGNPCVIQFTGEPDPVGFCSAFNGTYNGGTNRCSWTYPGYTPSVTFCMVIGSPSPYVSGGQCIADTLAANFTGTIANNSSGKALQVKDPEGLEVSNDSLSRALYLKVPSGMGQKAEVGFKDSIDNDGLKLVSPRGIELAVNNDDSPNLGIDIYDSYYDFSSTSPVITATSSDNKHRPLKFGAINADTVYTSIGNTPLNADGDEIAGEFNSDRVGVVARSWHGGLNPPAGTYSFGGGNAFRSAGLYALGNTTVNNAGAAIMEIMGGTVSSKLAWRDGSGSQWSILTEGNASLGGNVTIKPGFFAGGGNLYVTTGVAQKPGGGSWAVYSDARLKDVKDAFTRGLETLMKINPVKYSYKKGNAKGIGDQSEHIGLVAQEVQKVLPEAVSEGEDGYLTVDNDPIIWTMLNSIKELKAQNDALMAKNAELERKIDSLSKQINRPE